MKSLILMRHAKSDWNADFNRDFDRPLNKRGLRTAPIMGRFLLKSGNIPELILTSPADRALHTAQIVMETLGGGIQKIEEPLLYDNPASVYMDILRKTEDKVGKIMLVGHNPTMEELVALLCSPSSRLNIRMPTAALAYINLEIQTWNEIKSGKGSLGWLVHPKSITDII